MLTSQSSSSPSEDWDTLYEAASEDIDVLPNVEEAVAWVNDFIQRVETVKADQTMTISRNIRNPG